MGRDWPAADVAPLIVLIAEPGPGRLRSGTYRLSEIQARAHPGPAPATPDRAERDKIAEELGEVAS